MSQDLKLAVVANLHAQIRSELTRLLIRRLRQGVTVDSLCERLNWNSIQLWGRLQGDEDFTERTLADLAWALDAEIDIKLLAWEDDSSGAVR